MPLRSQSCIRPQNLECYVFVYWVKLGWEVNKFGAFEVCVLLKLLTTLGVKLVRNSSRGMRKESWTNRWRWKIVQLPLAGWVRDNMSCPSTFQPIYRRCALFLASSTSRTLFDRYLQQQHKGAQSPVLISKKEVRETVADVCVWILKIVLDFTTCFKTEFEWDNQSAAKKSSLAHFGTIRSKWAWGLNSRTYWNTLLLLLLTLSLSLSLLLMIDHAGLGLVIPLGCLPRPPWLQPFCLRCASLWTLGRTGSGCVFDEKIRKQLTCNCKKNLAVNPAFFFGWALTLNLRWYVDDLQKYHWVASCAIDHLASRECWDQPSIRGQQTAGQENDCGTGRWRVYMLGIGGFVLTVHTAGGLTFCCATFLLDSWCQFFMWCTSFCASTVQWIKRRADVWEAWNEMTLSLVAGFFLTTFPTNMLLPCNWPRHVTISSNSGFVVISEGDQAFQFVRAYRQTKTSEAKQWR